jgi:N-acetylglucosaminyldiphosphoundecaprenol N-acetyl-beta-D-mannosaminyltransferase
MSEKKSYSLFLFGAKPGIAEKMKKKLEGKFPELKIGGVRNGFFDWKKDTRAIVDEINASQANILLVAFGVPLQERWIYENAPKLKPEVIMGVGGLFDFYSGEMNRAPKWMREVGLEWLYRLMKEPKRMWKRYIIGNPLFLYRVYKWKNKKNR